MRIAVDAMGGDHAPAEVVKGAVQVAGEHGVEIILIGKEAVLEKEMEKCGVSGLPLSIVNASDVIQDGESPTAALQAKPDASIPVAIRMVKEGKADAVVSMGSTGAVLVSAMEILGKLEGVRRPSAGGFVCKFAPNTMVFDLGPNADCKSRDLLNFAVIGSVVARKILHIDNPTVALLSNGAEEGKGNLLVKKSYPLLKQSGLNFIGNVEGKDIPFDRANVIVCDGFSGNILLKFCEGLGEVTGEWLRRKLEGRLPQEEMAAISEELFALTHAAEEGGPIFGLDGIVVIGHGRAMAPQVAKAIGMARMMVEADLVPEIKRELAKLKYED